MISRRRFLNTVGVAAPVLAFPRLLLSQKTDAAKPVIGEGEFKYECEHFWGELPAGHNYGGASHGVALDSEGLIYVCHQGEPASVFVFDPAGKFVRTLGEFHKGDGHGIDIRREGKEEFIYLAPNNFSRKNRKVTKMTLKGEVVWEAGPPVESGLYKKGQPFNTTNISFAPDGGFHVGDGYGSNYLHRYDKQGNYISSMGGTGTGDGQFKTPHGHWFDDRDGVPKICVCDRANHRLTNLTLDGQFLSQVPNIDGPASLDTMGDLMLCTEVFIGRMVILDKHNKPLIRLGADDAWQKTVKETKNLRGQPDKWQAGKFVHPHDAAFDAKGNIFVAEWVVGGRISKLRKVS
jgi:hypothetical protein